MTDIYDAVRCARCGDIHDVDRRVRDGGRRLCPECGHDIAEPPADVEVDSPL